MKRVLQITMVLMGLALISLVIGLWASRPDQPMEPLMIGRALTGLQDQQQLYLIGLDSGLRRVITPALENLGYVGGPDDENWVYFQGARQIAPPGLNYSTGGLYRAKLLGRRVELLTAADGQSTFWDYARIYAPPDIYFALFDTALGTTGIYRISQEGGSPVAITPHEMDILTPPLVTGLAANHLIFHADTEAGDSHIYSMDMTDGQLFDLTPTARSSYAARWLEDVGWLVVSIDGELWKMRSDGSQATPLSSVFGLRVETWIPQFQLLVTSTTQLDQNNLSHSYIMAIRLSDGKTMWTVADRQYQEVSPDGDWILVSVIGGSDSLNQPDFIPFEIMRTDGTDYMTLTKPSGHFGEVWGWSPDGRSILYTIYHDDRRRELWRMVDGQAERLLKNFMGGVLAWSPTGHYAILSTMWLQVDSGKYGRILVENGSVEPVAWFNMPDRAWSPVRLLILGGGLLVGGFYRRRGKAQS